jgi:hypothetical protein
MKEVFQDIRNASGTLKIMALAYALLLAFGTASGLINLIINQAIIWVAIPGLFLWAIKNGGISNLPKDHFLYFVLILFFVICLPSWY